MNLAPVTNAECAIESLSGDSALYHSGSLNVDLRLANSALKSAELEAALTTLKDSKLFAQPASFYLDTPYQRPIRPQDITLASLSTRVRPDAFGAASYLAAHRLLLNRYEQDLVFLPRTKTLSLEQFKAFYANELRQAAERVRPTLEQHVFGWLDTEITITGHWSLAAFEHYTKGVLAEAAEAPSGLVGAIANAQDRRSAGAYYLVQCAGDFLSEASAMGRNVLGNFGSFTSELFKIFLDEYGYGQHDKKHSTIFEALLEQCDLSADLHTYWQFYTASSLALINYFHYVSVDHGKFFRYLGAMYYTEASLAFSTPHQSEAMRLAFGEQVDTLYFDEHTHIDAHHGRMALEKLIKPMVARFGEHILPDILRGFEEFRALQDIADQDLFRCLEWQDNLPAYKAQAMGMAAHVPRNDSRSAVFEEPAGELSVPHTHSATEHFAVESGMVEIVASPFKSIVLNAGDSLVIPHGVLHGSRVIADARYRVTALTAAQAWA